ncbi:MAG: acetate--CoA ligase [Bdellovibrionota bacterium]
MDVAQLYKEAEGGLEAFWSQVAERLSWIKKWDRVKDVSFNKPVHVSWFTGAKLNVCFNCVDRHALKDPKRRALVWESDNPQEAPRSFTYGALLEEVSLFANVLKKHGVKKGDRVTLYMPLIPEAFFAMLACARIGAVHSVVFGGFSSESIAGRLQDAQSEFVITANHSYRGGKKILLKENVDKALEKCPSVKKVLVIQRDEGIPAWNNDRDLWYHEEKKTVSSECPCEEMEAEDPLFILYTSGSTGKPKGVLHTSAGYLLYASFTHELVFNYKPEDLYWCTADVGWITGHSYVLYGPLSNAASVFIHEGVPNYPTPSRHWELIDKHQISIYYTAPTAIRSLMREGDAHVKKQKRSSLKLLGSVGEPLNPEAWQWYHTVVGEGRVPVVDTWWQTETGGILIAPIPGFSSQKPGSVAKPLPGIQAVLLDEKSQVLKGEAKGYLCLKDSWPGQMRSVYGDHKRFEKTYFSQYSGYYFSGDGAHRDAEGDFYITGRVDDVLNVSGHRIGTAELESALVGHDCVSEAAVVGFPHEIKGQGVYAFVTLKLGVEVTPVLRDKLNEWVRSSIGAIAKLDHVHFTSALPKTRSGKIMRRILRKIAEGDVENLGDISTLANPEIVEILKNEAEKV